MDGEDFVNFCGLLRKHELYLIVFTEIRKKAGKPTTNRKLVSCLSKEQTPSDLGKIEFYCGFYETVFREICKNGKCCLNGNFVVKYLIAND